MSVNDAFVMNEWRSEQKAFNVTFMPDGNGDFSRGMGMLVPKNDLGFGERSWRYSMLVKDGVIEKMFIEPDVPGDPFEVSDADTMRDYVAPDAAKPLDVTVFTRDGCEYCAHAKGMLNDAGIPFEELLLNRDFSEATIRAVCGASTVPQLFYQRRSHRRFGRLGKLFEQIKGCLILCCIYNRSRSRPSVTRAGPAPPWFPYPGTHWQPPWGS